MITKDNAHLEISVIPLPEDFPVRGNALASGDDELDREVEYEIIDRLNSGDQWAWCCAKVTVTFAGEFEESEYLGCCSYGSGEDFRENSGYYVDMVEECVSRINDRVKCLLQVFPQEVVSIVYGLDDTGQPFAYDVEPLPAL